jgi:hypothetical protein
MNNDFRGFLDQLKELEVMEQKEITTLAAETKVCEGLKRQLNEGKLATGALKSGERRVLTLLREGET